MHKVYICFIYATRIVWDTYIYDISMECINGMHGELNIVQNAHKICRNHINISVTMRIPWHESNRILT